MKTDKRLPYAELDESFLPPRDPVLGLIKVGGKDPTIRYTRAGKPWLAPTRLLDPARFEVVSREKRTKKVKGKPGTSAAGEDFTLDLGYVRDADFHALAGVGEKPSALKIRLLYPRWNQNLIAYLGAYGGREWVCRGNGVEAIDIKRGECACPCPRLVQFSGNYEGTKPSDKLICKPHAQLNVILEDAGVFGGFWAFKTTSYETISNLGKSLRMFEEMFGRIDGLPLELRVMATTKQIPGGGTTVQPIVTLVLPASMDTARQVAADAAAEARKFLPAGRELDHETYLAAVVSEMEEEAESYAGEFLPDGEVLEADEAPEAERNEGGAEKYVDAHETARGDWAEVDHQDEERESGDGPSVQAREDPPNEEADDPDETPSPDDEEAPDDSDRNDPEEPIEEYDRDDYELATKVLAAADGWTAEAIRDRLEYHRRTGTLDKLLERLEKNMPEAWAAVAEAAEPEDGLAF